MLNHVAQSVSFVAMLLAITLEAHAMYRLTTTRVTPTHTGINHLHPVGQWMGRTPEGWLCGVLLVLFYRPSTILVRPQSRERAEAQSDCWSVVRLWFWTVALGRLQLGPLYLDHFIGAH